MRPRITLVPKDCKHCGKRLVRGDREQAWDWKSRKFCDQECYFSHNRGVNHWAFLPGGSVRPDGYVRVAAAGGRKYLHRLVAEKVLGRPLRTDEHIHHKDGVKTHNEFSNFEITSNSGHRQMHAATQERNEYGRFS